jgi:hypothetical protein
MWSAGPSCLRRHHPVSHQVARFGLSIHTGSLWVQVIVLLYARWLGILVTLLTHIQEVPGSNLRWDTSYPSWFSSVLPVKCWDSTSLFWESVVIHSVDILNNILFKHPVSLMYLPVYYISIYFSIIMCFCHTWPSSGECLSCQNCSTLC